ncbi:hypothetical protein ANN_07657 [Periplaneta americana]|uniref:Per a allergen n=1 Tax=Periplaneta americana TaxID=6978 RepID=A0ABQ8T0L1_PERAM|nr:hypothetical protein ANN_07657 [Periplaneta americana]
MAGLCEGGNEPPGSLKALNFVKRGSDHAGRQGVRCYLDGKVCTAPNRVVGECQRNGPTRRPSWRREAQVGTVTAVSVSAEQLFGAAASYRSPDSMDTHSADKNSIKHATMRVLLFQIIAPEIPLPPQPVLTRWGTWLDAVNYYAEHYGKIMELIDALDSTSSSAVAAVKIIAFGTAIGRYSVHWF